MDFPVFHLDFFGNRLLIAVIAILHVMINHSLAVGAMPLVTLLEWWGHRQRDLAWDRLAHKLLFVCFVLTTSIGAMTGVGIWFASSLVNPAAIGSLIRVFFLAWFTEWVIFVLEVVFILVYFLSWEKWTKTHKRRHIAFGAFLSLFSWFTMAIIVAILGFMMDSGRWPESPNLVTGVLNPAYLPQLAFRTPLAMVAAGLMALMVIPFVTGRGDDFRASAIRCVSVWTLAWLPLCIAGAVWYRAVVPESMVGNLAVALTTQNFEAWHRSVLLLLAIAGVVIGAVAAWGVAMPRWLPRVALVVPFLLLLVMLGYFERAREFVRKPYVIQDYMYANGIRVQDYPLLREDGLLTHAAYTSTRTVTETNRVQAGQDVFLISCTRCHTTRGINGVVAKLEHLFGYSPWDSQQVRTYLQNMHNARPFMPPVPGNNLELDALTHYLCSLQQTPVPLEGAQTQGVIIPPP